MVSRGCLFVDFSMNIFATYFSAIVCRWEGSNLWEFDFMAWSSLYAVMTRVLIGGMFGSAQFVGNNCTDQLMRVSLVARL